MYLQLFYLVQKLKKIWKLKIDVFLKFNMPILPPPPDRTQPLEMSNRDLCLRPRQNRASRNE
jgi:hypothetical protein